MHSRITPSCLPFPTKHREEIRRPSVTLPWKPVSEARCAVKADSGSQVPQLALRGTLGTIGPALSLNDDSNGP